MNGNLPLSFETVKYREGLGYHASEVILSCVLGDQISCFKLRRIWKETLKSYFLLEETRDYDFKIEAEETYPQHKLSCHFSSACGRYAFWRLINNQASDAECDLRQLKQIVFSTKTALQNKELVVNPVESTKTNHKLINKLLDFFT